MISSLFINGAGMMAQATSSASSLLSSYSILSIIAVIIFFGFCVFIHELGHFLVARWRGLHVIAFSIGFKKVWEKEWRGVKYRLGILPFGGYVDLPQIDGSSDIPTDDKGNQLPRAKPIDRILVAFAGPLANILFGLLLAIPVWYFGVPGERPQQDQFQVTRLDATSPEYAAGLRNDDIIVKINGASFKKDWNEFTQITALATEDINLTVLRGDSELEISYFPAVNPHIEERLGKRLAYPFFEARRSPVCTIVKDSPASFSGMKNGDIIEAIQFEGKKKYQIRDIYDVFAHCSQEDSRPTWPCHVWVRRNGQSIDSPFVVNTQRQNYATEFGVLLVSQAILEVTDSANPVFQEKDQIWKINGVLPNSYKNVRETFMVDSYQAPVKVELVRDGKRMEMDVYPYPEKLANVPQTSFKFKTLSRVQSVTPNSAAERAGIKPGAYVFNYGEILRKYPQAFPCGESIRLKILNVGEDSARDVQLMTMSKYFMGVDFSAIKHVPPFKQFTTTIVTTAAMLKALGKKMINQKSNIGGDSMSGPLGIISVVHKVAQNNILSALSIIVMISFSLGLFNLFPIPILDVGHIVFGVLELVTRRPLPSSVLKVIFIIFFVLLIGLMAYVTVIDSFFVARDFTGKSSDPFKSTILKTLPENIR